MGESGVGWSPMRRVRQTLPRGHQRLVALMLAGAVGVLGLAASGCRLARRQKAVSESVATCRQLVQQGLAALDHGKTKEAEGLLDEAVEACPENAEARRHHAEALWRCGIRDAAIEQLTEAARLDPDNAAIQLRLAEMYWAEGHAQEARQFVETALDLDPKLAKAWALRARLLAAAGLPREALADCHRALSHAPGDRETLRQSAELYQRLDRPDHALQALQSLSDTYAPGEEPQDVYFLMGLACRGLGRYDEAAAHFSTAALRGNPNAEILYRLAESELLAGRPAEAAAAAQQALALDPDHQPTQQLIERLRLAGRAHEPPAG